MKTVIRVQIIVGLIKLLNEAEAEAKGDLLELRCE